MASPLPLISIVEATCRFAKVKGCGRSVIIGTQFTMSSGLYSDAFSKYGIDAVVPNKEEQGIIHEIIFPRLEAGIVDPEDKQKMLELVNRLLRENDADALVLGCTELPLMIKDGDIEQTILNTTRIHINEIVKVI
jgi:aspartate racemase